MAYFDSAYYTSYFDIAAATAAVSRTYGGYAPTVEEWQAYLKRLDEDEKERLAALTADRKNLRRLILDQVIKPTSKQIIVRTPETAVEPLPRGVEPKYRVRQIRLPYIPDAETEVRKRVAELLIEVRKRSRKIRKRKRDEAALIALLFM